MDAMSTLHELLSMRRSPLIMGIVNRTPDSFYDGGRCVDEDAAIRHAERLIAEGADLLDLGAESTRPGSDAVPAAEQIRRLGGAVKHLANAGVLVSVDTTSVEVAEHALEQGASLINSVSLEPAEALGALAARHGAALCLMHCRGVMKNMTGFSEWSDDAYDDVVADVARELRAAAERALGAGLGADALVLDPGLGFAKNANQSMALCARIDELCALGYPILVGASRKSFVAFAAASAGGGSPTAKPALPPPGERLGGSLAAALLCARRGAGILRVHDVAATRQALDVERAIVDHAGRTTGSSRAEASAHA